MLLYEYEYWYERWIFYVHLLILTLYQNQQTHLRNYGVSFHDSRVFRSGIDCQYSQRDLYAVCSARVGALLPKRSRGDMRRTSLSTHTREMMSLLLVIVLILLSCPPLCTAFLARMQRQHPQQHPQQLQHVSGERVGSKSDGSKRESRTSTSRSSSLAFAVRGAVPDCGQAGRDRHGKPRFVHVSHEE